ncbi:MAG: GC-type dockerin domain-anchored protein [Phycisphaerales bacterium]
MAVGRFWSLVAAVLAAECAQAQVMSREMAGACCLPDGSCSMADRGACERAGGVFRGEGARCADAACAAGACCLPAGVCLISSGESCARAGGAYFGDGSECGSVSCSGRATGPDIVVTTVQDMKYLDSEGPYSAYSIGVHICNNGDTAAEWFGATNRHPVVAQNLYRLKNGRLEQLGHSWVKHAFSAENEPSCGVCVNPGTQTLLGVRCGDVYGAQLNGSQNRLGPKSQINVTTGAYPYPFSAPTVTSLMDRRLRVLTADISPSLNKGAVYIAEARLVTPDDAQANNGLNNASYCAATNLTNGGYQTLGPSRPGQPAILAWKEYDPEVTVTTVDYTDTSAGVPITARFWVAALATPTAAGTWRYEYAVYNHNAERAAGSFTVPLGARATISGPGFGVPASHSGEPYSNAAWTATVSATSLSWATTPQAADPRASALRWGTMANFWFEASSAPGTGSVTLGLFVPGTPTSLNARGLPVPGAGSGTPCYPNCDGSTAHPVLNVADLSCFLDRFAASHPYANCDGSTTNPVFNIHDFSCFLARFAQGCP